MSSSTDQFVPTPTQMTRRQWLITALSAGAALATASALGRSAFAASKTDGAAAAAAPGPVYTATFSAKGVPGGPRPVTGWFQSLAAAPTEGFGKQPPGQVKAEVSEGPFRIDKWLDEATPALNHLAHSGETVDKATLTLYRDGEQWLRADFHGVRVLSSAVVGSVAGDPTERLSFTYEKAGWHALPAAAGKGQATKTA